MSMLHQIGLQEPRTPHFWLHRFHCKDFFINLLELYHHPMQCLAQLLWDNVCGPVLKIQRTELLLQPLLNLVPVNFDKVSF